MGRKCGELDGSRSVDPNFLVVRYEDLLRRTQAELYRVAALLQIDVTPERLALAVERSTAKQMRKMEKQEGHLWASTKDTRQDISFIRAATDGQWQSVLSSSSVQKIEAAWGHLMLIFGYNLAYVRVEKEKSLRISNLLPALSGDMRGAAMPAQVAM